MDIPEEQKGRSVYFASHFAGLHKEYDGSEICIFKYVDEEYKAFEYYIIESSRKRAKNRGLY